MPKKNHRQKKRQFSAFDHLQQVVSWSTATLLALSVLLLPRAAAMPTLFTRTNDNNAAVVLRRSAPACTNYTTVVHPGFSYVDKSPNNQGQPNLASGHNNTYITYTSSVTTTPTVKVNAILDNDLLLLPNGSNDVSTNIANKNGPKIIVTKGGLVIPFYVSGSLSYFSKIDPNTLNRANNVNGFPLEQPLSTYDSGSGQNRYSNGVGLDGGGHIEAFTSQEVSLNYQVFVRAYQTDDVTPLFDNLQLSTNTSYITANPIVSKSKTTSGNFTGIWQRQISVTKPNELVSRRFNCNGTNINFIDAKEKLYNSQVPALVGKNCFNALQLDRADGSTVISFQNQNISTGTAQACFIIVDNTGVVTKFQTIPLTITADTTQFIPLTETPDGFAVTLTGTGTGKQKLYIQRFYDDGNAKDTTPIQLDAATQLYGQRSPSSISHGNGL
ncbi:MAG TPA: hypothetical protein VI522_00820, partial [Gammaproteobacteria bacterium]|nr:hypothetical protein [Gammaproteobacteria bacterium]